MNSHKYNNITYNTLLAIATILHIIIVTPLDNTPCRLRASSLLSYGHSYAAAEAAAADADADDIGTYASYDRAIDAASCR